jgi:hypothetical protein
MAHQVIIGDYNSTLPMMLKRAVEGRPIELSLFWSRWSECTKKFFVDKKEELGAQGYRDTQKQFEAERELWNMFCK